MRERGLKHDDVSWQYTTVAPHAGAWIETLECINGSGVSYEVAPHAGSVD